MPAVLKFVITFTDICVLWTENIIESFLFMLHHPGTLSAGLLNSLKEHEVV